MHPTLSLAIFDLDNTLLRGDSDYEWGEFLIAQGAVDREYHGRRNAHYYEQYKAGTLDIYEFLAFQLRPLSLFPRRTLEDWRAQFLATKVLPQMITPAARALVERHRAAGDTLLIITATNSFITRPIAAEFGIAHLIATEPEEVDGRFTGRVAGVPSYREGKVTRLHAWLAEHRASMAGSWFYSDSHNDLPLLGEVDHPVAANPDDILAAHARAHGWAIVELH